MAKDARSLYDQLASNYHLIFQNWDSSIRRQGVALQKILAWEGVPGTGRILDCACGIGTQMIALASHGFRVTGCDFSSASVERARGEAEKRGLNIPVFVADMADLTPVPEDAFDVVISMDNALPHFDTDDQLLEALIQIRSKLPKGKLFMASIRDYDAFVRQRPAMVEPSFFLDSGMRRIVHQVWDWIDERRYIFHLYITRETESGWENQHYVSSYRALLRDELGSLLKRAGFTNCRWLLPGESAFYQPIVLATAG